MRVAVDEIDRGAHTPQHGTPRTACAWRSAVRVAVDEIDRHAHDQPRRAHPHAPPVQLPRADECFVESDFLNASTMAFTMAMNRCSAPYQNK